jgi:CBS domain containing-hemolysin-like protein
MVASITLISAMTSGIFAITFAILGTSVLSAVQMGALAASIGGVMVMAGAMSNVVETALETISSAVLGILIAIVACLGTVLSFFGN